MLWRVASSPIWAEGLARTSESYINQQCSSQEAGRQSWLPPQQSKYWAKKIYLLYPGRGFNSFPYPLISVAPSPSQPVILFKKFWKLTAVSPPHSAYSRKLIMALFAMSVALSVSGKLETVYPRKLKQRSRMLELILCRAKLVALFSQRSWSKGSTWVKTINRQPYLPLSCFSCYTHVGKLLIPH